MAEAAGGSLVRPLGRRELLDVRGGKGRSMQLEPFEEYEPFVSGVLIRDPALLMGVIAGGVLVFIDPASVDGDGFIASPPIGISPEVGVFVVELAEDSFDGDAAESPRRKAWVEGDSCGAR